MLAALRLAQHQGLSLAFGSSKLIRFKVIVGRVAVPFPRVVQQGSHWAAGGCAAAGAAALAAAGFLPAFFLRFAMVRVCAVVRSALMLRSSLS